MRAWRWTAWTVCAGVLAANAWHLAVQASPPSWDDAWYLETSFRFYWSLLKSPLAFMREYAGSFKIKAPLISLLPLPLYFFFGAGERIALWVNEICLAATLALVYAVGKTLYGEKAGLGAAAAAALLPMLYGVSRIFLVECALTTAVCAGHWAILRARPESRAAPWALGLALGLGLLIKSIFPLYLLGPVWLKRRDLRPHAKAALLIAALVAGTWYAFNAPYVVGFGLSAGFGGIARDYGKTSVFSPSVLGLFLARVGREVFSWPYLLAAAATLALAWASRPKERRPLPADFYLLAWFLPPAAVFAFGVNKDLRYLAPALPAAAIALGTAAASLPRRRDAFLVIALLTLPIKVFCTQTFGIPAGPELLYNGPPSADPGWSRGALIDEISRLAPAAPGEEPVVAVAVEHRLLNANNLASLSAARGLPHRFISLGYAQTSGEAALIRLRDKNARYLVFADGIPREDLVEFINRANAAVEGYIWDGRLRAKLLAETPLTNGIQARLYGIKP